MSKERWKDDLTQFARLLNELEGIGLTNYQIREIGKQTDLSYDDIAGLFERAGNVWDAAKARVPKDTSGKRFYRNVIVLEVLAREKGAVEALELKDVVQECIDGEFSGDTLFHLEEDVDGPTMAKLLIDQRSSPGFFDLDDDGNYDEETW